MTNTITKLYKYTENALTNERLPPQAAAIVEEIKNRRVVTKEQLFDALSVRFQRYAQTPESVFAFYRARLIKSGYMIEITL
jgi:hypothetical protein